MKMILVLLILIAGAVPPARAADDPELDASPVTTRASRVNLDFAKQRAEAAPRNEVQIVQNRKYTKAQKFEIGVFGGWVSADAFLNISAIGGFVAYHFSENWGVRGFYWKDHASHTDGWTQVQHDSGILVNTNAPTSMLGAELIYTPMYGKVSLFDSSIVYYDFSVFAGLGNRSTESGSGLGPVFGLGQQFFFAKRFAVGVDYRIMHYTETVIDQQPQSLTYGQAAGTRTDFTHIVYLSLSVFL